MFEKILIANRGEIAVRIIRACRAMNIKTVAVYSTADKHALHVYLADESVCIGPPAARDSYLNIAAILSAAKGTGAQAIHPGYGFLSENSTFAKLCRENDIVFIGPAPEVIDRMGNKSQARKTMMEAGVPVVPGTKEPVHAPEEALAKARDVGWPIMIKASSGGGGKGMRVSPVSYTHLDVYKRQAHDQVGREGLDELLGQRLGHAACTNPHLDGRDGGIVAHRAELVGKLVLDARDAFRAQGVEVGPVRLVGNRVDHVAEQKPCPVVGRERRSPLGHRLLRGCAVECCEDALVLRHKMLLASPCPYCTGSKARP